MKAVALALIAYPHSSILKFSKKKVLLFYIVLYRYKTSTSKTPISMNM